MKESHPHSKHGDRTEIIETTIIPENLETSSTPVRSSTGQVFSGQTVGQTTGPIPLVSQPRISSTIDAGHITSTTPIVGHQMITDQPGQTVRKIIDKTTIEHHEDHGSIKEKIKDKAKDVSDKILGFIPNPFSHKDKATESSTTETSKFDTQRPIETITYTTSENLSQPLITTTNQTTTTKLPLSQMANIPTTQLGSNYYDESTMTKTSIPQSTIVGQTSSIPQSTLIGQTINTKTVTHIPSTGTAHLSCDEKKTS